MMAGLRQIVDPPSFTPIPYGLLTTVEWPQASGPHWQNGITYVSTCGVACTGLGGSLYDDCISVTGTGGKPPPFNVDMTDPASSTVEHVIRGATAFTVGASFICSTVGNDQAQAEAERAMTAAEPWAVERSFWTGQAGLGTQVVFPHLAADTAIYDPDGILLQPAAIDVGAAGDCSPHVSGDGTDAPTAFGLLEAALASSYGGIGVIHIPELLVPTLQQAMLINMPDSTRPPGSPVMHTLNGNKVAVGGGYSGSGPNGGARTGGKCWIYATGNVFGYRSEVRVRSPQSSAASLDRATNTRAMIAERTYVIGWDCALFAVQIDLGCCGVPSGPT